MSFMGKGVTKSAILCLLHLSHEMSIQALDEVKFSSISTLLSIAFLHLAIVDIIFTLRHECFIFGL